MDIVGFCKKHNIELVLFVAPEPEWTIVGKGNYSEYHSRLKEISTVNGVGFYDFNLCKSAYFDANDRGLFRDEDHLNAYGADLFTTIFAEFFTGRILDEDLFFDSYEEKLKSEDVIVYGVAGFNENETGEQRNAYIISNRDEGLEYRIVATIEEHSFDITY